MQFSIMAKSDGVLRFQQGDGHMMHPLMTQDQQSIYETAIFLEPSTAEAITLQVPRK